MNTLHQVRRQHFELTPTRWPRHHSGRARKWRWGITHPVIWLVLFALLLPPTAPSVHAQNGTVTGTIIIAVAADAPPFAAQADNGQIVGFDVDLIKLLVRTAGLHVTYEAAPFVQLIPGVATQLYDAAVGCITTTDERKSLVDFSDSYFTTGNVFVFSKNSAPVYDLTDLTPETTISTMAETAGWSFLSKQSEAKIIATTTVQRALEMAAARLADAAFVDEITTDRYMRTHPEAGLQVVSGLVQSGGCGIAVSKENPRLLLELNAALTRLKNNGKYLTIYRRWFGSRPLAGPRPVQRPIATVEGQSDATALTLLAQPTANVPFADNVSGAYAVTLLTEPLAYQLVELTADGRWLESNPVPDAATLRGIKSLAGAMAAGGQVTIQEGRWQGLRLDPLGTTVELSATLPLTTALAVTDTAQLTIQPHRDYQLAINDNGQLQGFYTLYTAAVPTDTATLSALVTGTVTGTVTAGITNTVPITETVKLTGQRLVE